MDGTPIAVILFGTLATIACGFAFQGAWEQRRQRRTPFPLLAFWGTVGGYMFFFTLLRIAAWQHWEGLVPIFYAQTLCGAATVISLAYILVGVIIGPRAARAAMEVAGAAAVMVVTLIFGLGTTAPVFSTWGVEMLPVSQFARMSIAVVYVALPVALAGLAVYVARASGDADRRLTMFSGSVALMYVPNAIKYVVLVSGPMGVALAVVMAGGAMIGAAAYKTPDNG